ncbi:uncharacterized protein FOMMEDRAFT_110885 [Fomitiporia mediterranea MF3/22]|uniref:uncharacterized protein n=1 Tax=Fomitiporia mediterranea (strain MF3/22) TaxID=694068 RepID=UPI0004409B01|nr:uncharacterized protein FOMMEDRAFT_110885 [Fomitiporia mediterranea MF3/22]EJD01229.1 hypothetical protein FOMMEDRAFT_110885 [Fomitiporia mediterranea MF3/22]
MASRRRSLQIFLFILALFLIGTVVVLSSISIYLSIDPAAYLTEEEIGPIEEDATWNATALGKTERIPRIIHQTWKSETLPDRWKSISEECRAMMPDYDYKLWTDADSREFIAKEYPWFLDTFDAYPYPIQRADAIRYFVLHFYGGVYLDLDVGCRRRLDRLLVYPVILPRTIPVGVSNDLMFAEKHHPFMAQTIHNLVTFDHNWILNYPTVMFSTGPMFLSAQYGIWTSSHFPTPDMPGGEVRVLPKALYGKNAKVEDVPHSFFLHFYGSSWHADDAAFIGFLGTWGKGLMWIGLILLIAGLINLYWRKSSKRSDGYQIMLPWAHQRNGRWNVDLGLFTLTSRVLPNSSPTSSRSPSPSPDSEGENVPMLPLPFDMRPPSPFASSDASVDRRTGIVGVLSRYRVRVMTTITGGYDRPRGRQTARRIWPARGYLFFLPAIFTPGAVPVPEQGSRRPSNTRSLSASGSRPRTTNARVPEKHAYADDDLEDATVYGASSGLQAQANADGSSQVFSRPPTPGASGGAPPSYHAATSDTANAAARRPRSTDGTWDSWEAR